jgi:small nuclear ribonucleoprotein (snRNP)-like protein
MELEDFLNKYIIIELKDGVKEEGILVEIKDFENEETAYTSLVLRDPDSNYKIVYLNEIETLGELI